MKITHSIYITTREEWRKWLKKNHNVQTEVWLIYYKKHTGKPRIAYDDAVEEALCFGWIDSTIQRIDDEKYAQRFTPRKNLKKWSELNKQRVKKLIKAGLMTEAGFAKIDRQVFSHSKTEAKKEFCIPDDMKQAFEAEEPAWTNFLNLAPSYRRKYMLWITKAKREATRHKRLKEAIELLKENKKLGMK
jgi:uncharacterized protein YdeI (YjbR/CyaY-like superfamily)